MNTRIAPPPDFAPCFHSRHVPQGDKAQMRDAFALRYQVYCLEQRFLPAERYPLAQESDLHDERSAHFCSYNLAQQLVGYVRLVPPGTDGQLPLHQHCPPEPGTALQLPLQQCAEISRLMVRHDYRRRRGDLLAGVAAPDGAPAEAGGERRSPSPQIMLSLYKRMFIYSLDHGLRYWFAAMERPLARAVTQMGFAFRQIGAHTDYYGPVAPYLADLQELQAQVGARHPELLAWLGAREAGRG